VSIPLEETYQQAWFGFPERRRRVLEAEHPAGRIAAW
jgi:hypothetical protein